MPYTQAFGWLPDLNDETIPVTANHSSDVTSIGNLVNSVGAGLISSGKNFVSDIKNYGPAAIEAVKSRLGFDQGSAKQITGSFSAGGPSAPVAKDWSYINADLAQAYGMDKSAAYNEAMANTAYQRAVKDMQTAGLNPALMFNRAGPADSPFAYGSGGYSHGGSSGASRGSNSAGKAQGIASLAAGLLTYLGTRDAGAALNMARIAGSSAKAIASSK